VRAPQRTAARTGQLGRALSTLVDRRSIVPSTMLNVRVGRRRRFEGVRVALDDVKTIRQALGGTVNDVVLAGVAGGLRRLFEARGEDVTDLRLRALCPVSVRDDSERMQLGNRVSAMFVDLPVGEADAVQRLEVIRGTTGDLKDRQQAVGAAFLVDLTQFAAPTLLGLAARLAHRQPFFNLVITNVPGPQVPLYCMGGRMLEAYPVVPLTRNTALGIAILSYCGQLHIGLYVDADALDDVTVLAAALEDSFAELKKIAIDEGEGSS
jgi:WS/DGAT/MGAT family acyltransferase